MSDQTENCGVNNTLLSLNTSSIKEEEVDNKVHVSETGIIANSFELQDYMRWHDKIEYETSIIKAEFPSSEGQNNVINDNVKIEEEISADNIKIEYNNRLLYCDHCQAYYEDYCIKCGMLLHILNRNAPDNTENRTQDELPNDILEIRHLFGQCGVLALKVIPEGVQFGPFTGLCRTESVWKIKGGKFVVDDDRSRYLNWMLYINPARNMFEGNLIVLQREDYLYYQSTRQILPGEELSVYFSEECIDSLNQNIEVDFIPTTEHFIKDIFACTFCCLGFSSKSHLVKHKMLCLGDAGSDFLFEDLTQCPFCKIHFGQNEYLKHHFAYCSTRNDRERSSQTLSYQMNAVTGRKIRHSAVYKCEQCNYRTKYKADLKKHTIKQHYTVRKSKCGICYRRFETKEYLRLHIENTHISVGVKEDPAHSRCDYQNTHIKIEQSTTQEERKIFKCPLCGLRTQHRESLARHMNTKHLKEFTYKCDSCEYRTNIKNHLEYHIKAKHLKEFNYECENCEYKTENKSNIEYHMRREHLKEFNYECDACEFRTTYKHELKRHTKVKHSKDFDFMCDSCEFKTTRKDRLERHIKSKHLKEFDFKCDSCEYNTNNKDDLKRHIKSKHLKEIYFKCDSCEFKTNYKNVLKSHIKTKHLKEFDFKCEFCQYETNFKYSLERHTKTNHSTLY